MGVNNFKLIDKIKSDKLSLYRTEHTFVHYSEPTKLDEILEVIEWAKENKIKFYFLGNGSNILFKRDTIESLIVRNNIPSEINKVGEDTYFISSSTPVSKVLKKMFNDSRDCFYYLASVPATIGGALTMNAGRGIEYNNSILDFVEEIYFIENGKQKSIKKDLLEYSYRMTFFTKNSELFIYGALFNFKKIKLADNPIKERINYSKVNQDYGKPNCGSVFKKANPRILNYFRNKTFRIGKAYWSNKTYNWIVNEGNNFKDILYLIRIVQFCHFLVCQRAITEVRIID